MGSPNKPAAQFILDMDPDDLLERAFRRKPQLPRATRVEAAGPAGDDCCDRRIGFAPNAFGCVVARDFAQSLDLLGHRRGDARHGQVAPSPEPRGIDRSGVDQEADRRAGEACQCITSSGTGSTASSPLSGSRMMLEKKPEAALLGLPGRTQIVGSRMPTPSKKPRRL